MQRDYSNVDRWLIRAKDIIIVIGAIATFLAFGIKLYALPTEVTAHAKELKAQDARITAVESFMATTNVKLSYIASSIDELKTRREVYNGTR